MESGEGGGGAGWGGFNGIVEEIRRREGKKDVGRGKHVIMKWGGMRSKIECGK